MAEETFVTGKNFVYSRDVNGEIKYRVIKFNEIEIINTSSEKSGLIVVETKVDTYNLNGKEEIALFRKWFAENNKVGK